MDQTAPTFEPSILQAMKIEALINRVKKCSESAQYFIYATPNWYGKGGAILALEALRDDERIKACNWDYWISKYNGQPDMYLITHGIKEEKSKIQVFGILTTKQQFCAWVEDGNVYMVGKNEYREQSTQWRKAFTLKELYRFFIKEYINA